MADIFIGYAREDRPTAKLLARVLEQQGWSVWWDIEVLPGQTFDDVISHALAEARCIVVLWSKTSVVKHWVKTEAEEGRQRNILVPVLLEEAPIPMAFRWIQAEPLTGWNGEVSHQGLKKVLKAISNIVGPSPTVQKVESHRVEIQERMLPDTPPQVKEVPWEVKIYRRVSLFLSSGNNPRVLVLLGMFLLVIVGYDFLLKELGFAPSPPPSPPKITEDQSRTEVAQQETPKSIQTEGIQPVSTNSKKSLAPSESKKPESLKVSMKSFGTPEVAREVTGKDGAPMMLVPAGEFLYGDNNQRMSLTAFYIDKYEVTARLYSGFLKETHRALPTYWEQMNPKRDSDRPVVGITWQDADAYCRHYKKRLPTAQEWEKAARGTDGRKYPWGDGGPNKMRARYDHEEWAGYITLAPVESYPAGKSPYGIYNMAGNVWEWTSSDYGKNGLKEARGGSWGDVPENLESSGLYSADPSSPSDAIGFRCAQEAR